MVKAVCMMMQKNEELLLEPWILHHGYLFGFENLFVFDNGSTSPLTRDVLERYRRLGLNVRWDKDTPNDFDLKGWIMRDLIREFQAEGRYDYYLPIDCDEFLTLAGAGGLTMHRQPIHDYLHAQLGVKTLLRINHCLNNVPGRCDLFAVQGHRKSVIPRAGLHMLDHGFHEAELETGKDGILSDLVHIHLHNKPHGYLLQSARDKLAPFVDVDDLAALRDFNGVGNHLKKYFLYSPAEYYDSMRSLTCVAFDGFAEFLAGFRLFDFASTWGQGAPTVPGVSPQNIVPARADDASGAPAETLADHAPAISDVLLRHRALRSELDRLKHASLQAISARDWPAALAALAEYRERDPDDPEGFAWSARALRESDLHAEAEALCGAALKTFPMYEPLFLEWALICFNLRCWDMGESRFAEFRRRFPWSREGYVRGIEIARELGDDAAIATLTAELEARF